MGFDRVVRLTVLKPGDFLLLGIVARILPQISTSRTELIDLGVVIKATMINDLIKQYLSSHDRNLIEYYRT